MYWDPFEEIDRMHEEMERMFSRFYMHADRPALEHKGQKAISKPMRSPVCHLHETESQVIATFELPGVNKGDIELNVDKDHIEVKVENRQEQKKEEKGTQSYMASHMSFHRYIALPKEIDAAKAKAKYENGVLRVEMPKIKEIQSGKRLQIE